MFRVYWTLNYHLCMQVSTTHEVSYVYSIYRLRLQSLFRGYVQLHNCFDRPPWYCKYF